jgi:DNA-3-methyladenine glycosylase I
MERKRCGWVNLNNPLYVAYHDTEWAVPTYDDRRLFEFLILEGAQAGLSWETILNRREGFRNAFSNFNYKKIVLYTVVDIDKLLQNTEIIRNRLKIRSAIQNAKVFISIQKEYGSFSSYLWRWVDHGPIQHHFKAHTKLPIYDTIALALSMDLKKRGMKFVGPTICYAYMQAIGMVNDHTSDCFRYTDLK